MTTGSDTKEELDKISRQIDMAGVRKNDYMIIGRYKALPIMHIHREKSCIRPELRLWIMTVR